jgi:TPM domain
MTARGTTPALSARPHAAPLARVLMALAAGLALLVLTAGPLAPRAAAEEPLRLDERVTDLTTSGVVGSTDEARAAVATMEDATDYRLYAVYVDSFDGTGSEDWANEVAELSDLGDQDLLLAIAVDDRAFALSATDSVSDSTYDRAYTAAEDALTSAADDGAPWADATVATAQALQGSGGAGGLSGPLVVGGVVVAGAAVGIGVVASRRRRNGSGATTGRAGAPQGQSTQQLVAQAGPALVEIDDDLREFEQDLGFAEAQFGAEATREFSASLAQAKPQVAQAFTLRKQLDEIPESDDAARRAVATQILQICQGVSQQLGAQAQAFDALRQEQANVPATLEELGRRAEELRGRVEPARATLVNLAVQYPPTALASVSSNPDHASQLIEGAGGSVVTGQQHVASGDAAAAVAQAQVARNALTQAAALLDAVDSAQQDLANASARLQEATASITADVADADRLAPGDAALAPLTGAARQALAAASSATAPGGDPPGALAALADAETALDAALAPRREQAEVAQRARAQIGERTARLDSAIRSTNAYIDARRGAVGPEARTRLAEAIRLLGVAHEESGGDPQRAVATLQQAEGLAGSASQLAQADVAQWEQQQSRQGYGGYGSSGGGGLDLGSLILGGMLGNNGSRRSSSWSSGGSWGGGSSWGGGGSSWGGGSSRRSSSSRSSSSRRSSSSGRSSGGSRGRSRGGRF